MPKSKRAKVVTLSKTESKGREGKSKLISKLQGLIEDSPIVYIVTIENNRTKLLQHIRNDLRDQCSFYFGKKSLVKLAFGTSSKDSYTKNSYLLSESLLEMKEQDCGLVFSTTTHFPNCSSLQKKLKQYEELEFCRGGFTANEDMKLEAGPLPQFESSMFERLRKLGMKLEISRGSLTLLEDFELCSKGERTTPEQSEMLKLLGHKLATFKIVVRAQFKGGRMVKPRGKK